MPARRASAPSGRARRLFVAVEVPPSVRAAVGTAFAPWRDALPSARWVPAADWHVTVRFVGPVLAGLLDRVRAAVAGVAAGAASFPMRLSGIGAFPSPARATVLWAGLEDPAGRAGELARALDDALAEEFPAPARPFRPHLTVARCDRPLRLPASFTGSEIAQVDLLVDRVVLFESVTGRGPVRYEPLMTCPLGMA